MSRRSPTATRVRDSGPLAPFRLAASVGAAAAFTGPALADATASGEQLDLALGRSIALATVTWVALGAINRVLAQAAATTRPGVERIDPGADSAQVVEQ